MPHFSLIQSVACGLGKTKAEAASSLQSSLLLEEALGMQIPLRQRIKCSTVSSDICSGFELKNKKLKTIQSTSRQ